MTKDQKEKEIYFNLVLKNNSEELKNKLNEIGCEKWLSKACKIPKKIWQDLEVGSIIYIKKIEKKYGYKKVGEDDKGKPIFEKDMNKIEWWLNDFEVINSLIDNIIEELEDANGENEF